MEIWRDVPLYEGCYQVSNQGSVRNIRTNKILKVGYSKSSNYPCVVLSKDGAKKTYAVHRLVATVFIPNPSNYPEVNHINEVKSDNRVENLEWCTRQYNIRYGTAMKRRVERTKNCKKRSKAIVQMNKQGEDVRIFPSMHEMERQTGFHRSFVKRCIDGKRPTAYGYLWRFKEL